MLFAEESASDGAMEFIASALSLTLPEDLTEIVISILEAYREESAESFIALDCEAGAAGAPAVIWCDAHVVDRLDDLQVMSNLPETWPGCAAFFQDLLDEEGHERGMAVPDRWL